jgi:hypothetical protein
MHAGPPSSLGWISMLCFLLSNALNVRDTHAHSAARRRADPPYSRSSPRCGRCRPRLGELRPEKSAGFCRGTLFRWALTSGMAFA